MTSHWWQLIPISYCYYSNSILPQGLQEIDRRRGQVGDLIYNRNPLENRSGTEFVRKLIDRSSSLKGFIGPPGSLVFWLCYVSAGYVCVWDIFQTLMPSFTASSVICLMT